MKNLPSEAVTGQAIANAFLAAIAATDEDVVAVFEHFNLAASPVNEAVSHLAGGSMLAGRGVSKGW